MTEPSPVPPSPGDGRRLEQLRERRAAAAADRAAFEANRRHGLRSRHAAKLAHLAARARAADESQEAPSTDGTHDNTQNHPEGDVA
ncbi:hypothetical protein [Actinophytocola xanthii]|uniref:Uncharacterized protein n=1 Tax=Actinophytocola xanthii TaxID=1912961 RepID=A0A1Q8CXE6_9PSEU|nr:hypothetical protein [Actinophytocola xanthii]OLF19023.1 hypothetical protein BU204_04010 [Actinophytocola xanthii]